MRWLTIALLFALPTLAADLYVATTGSDAAAGDRAHPLATISAAAAKLQPGDTCRVAAGVYRGTVRPAASGEPDRPIRFIADGDVTVTGTDALTGEWTQAGAQTWQLRTDLRFEQLFCDGQMMTEARWPNTPLGDLMVMHRAEADEGTTYDRLVDAELPPGDFNGAVMLLWPGSRWGNATRRVVDYQAGQGFRFDSTLEKERKDPYHTFDPYKPIASNPYLLYGVLAALDSPGEWFQDPQTGIVTFWAPDGRSPAAHRIEVKQRPLAFDLHGLQYIRVQGFKVTGAAIDLTDAQHCWIEDCHLRYIDHRREFDTNQMPPTRNVVTGRANTWRQCSLAYAAGALLKVGGEDNVVQSCYLWDGNYIGGYQSLLDLGGAVGVQILGCTICRAGRDVVQHHRAKRIRIERCDIWGANLLNNDSGATYAWGTDGEGSVIAYNWVHDNVGDSTVGIYLDNFSRNYLVHHNVVWNNSGTGIRLNSDSLNNLIANNTIAMSARPFGTFTYTKYEPTMEGTRILNNLVLGALRPDDPQMFVQGAKAPELSHNGAYAIGQLAMPNPGSGAIDAGLVIPGVTDGFVGQAPDIGAYEFGGEAWVPGAPWPCDDAPQALPINLTFIPRPPVTANNMITEGLQVWLDAADRDTLELNAAGELRRWRDKSGRQHDGLPYEPEHLLRVEPAGLGGHPMVAGTGEGSLRLGTFREEPGAFTLYLVARGPVAGGPSWQRLIGCQGPDGDEWVRPNWMLGRAGGATPEAVPPQLFHRLEMGGCRLQNVTLFGSALRPTQFFLGEVGELLIYDRALRFDEQDAIEQYLNSKWGL